MDDRRAQFQVGLLVVAALALAGMLVVLFGESPALGTNQYTVYIRFPQAPGVRVDTPIHKSGILIGRVARVTLLDSGGVVVTARIDDDRRLSNNEVCRISRGAILGGDAVLEFVPTSVSVPSAEVYRDGEYLDGIVARDPLSAMDSATSVLEMLSGLEEDMRLTLVAIESAGRRVGDVAQSLNGAVANNKDQIERIFARAEGAMQRFESAATSVDEIVSNEDLKMMIDQTIVQLPDLLVDGREVLDGLKGMVARADQNLRNIENLTEPLGQNGPALARTLEKTLSQIDVAMADLTKFSKALNNSDGTLNRLLHDDELYESITQSAENIELLTQRLRPIVEDARVFTDKVARDPGRLGLKGMLDRSQSGGKY